MDPPGDDAETQRRLKYPYVACEVFCCDVDAVYTTLLEKIELLDKLFAFLDAPRPLDALSAGYFSRVVACLLARRPQELGAYLNDRRQGALARMCEHVETPSVAELIKKLYGADPEAGGMGGGGLGGMYLGGGMGMGGPSPSASGGPSDVTSWIADSGILSSLVDATCGQKGDSASRGASNVIVAVARSAPPHLRAALLGDVRTTERLIECAVEGSKDDPSASAAATAPRCALEVCAAMCLPSEMDSRQNESSLPHSQGSMNFDANVGFFGGGNLLGGGDGLDDDENGGGGDASDVSADIDARQAVARLIAARASELAVFLDMDDAPSSPPEPLDVDELEGDPLVERQRFLPVAHGYLLPPLGARRLGVARLFSALARSGDAESMRALAREDVCGKLMALCLRYPFNSALHHETYTVADLMLSAALDPNYTLVSPKAGDANSKDASDDDAAAAEVANLCLRAVINEPCALARRLAEAPVMVGGEERAPGAALFCPRRIRAGYLGHFLKLANRLVALTSVEAAASKKNAAAPSTDSEKAALASRANAAEWVRGVLAADAAWTSYVAEDLPRFNAKADVNGWQCGRPARMGSNSLSGDEDDPMSSMFGGVGGVVGGLGGLGSLTTSHLEEDEDEDDEDDEDEEDEEDEDEDEESVDEEDVVVGDGNASALGLSLGMDASMAHAAGTANRYGDADAALSGGAEEEDGVSVVNAPLPADVADDFNPRAPAQTADSDASLSEAAAALSSRLASTRLGESSSDSSSNPGEKEFDAFRYWRVDLHVEVPEDA